MAFVPPVIFDNEDGWGPSNTLPSYLTDTPFLPYSKSDKLGRVADFTAHAERFAQRAALRQKGREGAEGGLATAAVGGGMFALTTAEDTDSFQLVDTRQGARARGEKNIIGISSFRRRPFPSSFKGASGRGRPVPGSDKDLSKAELSQKKKQPPRSRWQKWKGKRFAGAPGGARWGSSWYQGEVKRTRDASVDIRPEWSVVEQIELNSFAGISLLVKEAEDLLSCGSLQFYTPEFDKITTKSGKPLERTDRSFHRSSTSDDPNIRALAMEGSGNVFATDSILSLLMASPRTVYPWDVVVNKIGSKLFFEKRYSSQIDFLTVNETAKEPPADEKDSINSPQKLSEEATIVNQQFIQQVLHKGGKTVDFSSENPFPETGSAFRYRRWNLGDDVVLVSRCELDGATNYKGREIYLSIKALNEYDPSFKEGMDWRQKLDSQRGAVLATELKNNAAKLGRWAAQAVLSGADLIKLGYVSRVHPKDNSSHVILGVQTFQVREFATQANININHMWGTLKSYIELCMDLPDGKYILVRDPNAVNNKPIVRLYNIPEAGFGERQDEEEMEGEEKDV